MQKSIVSLVLLVAMILFISGCGYKVVKQEATSSVIYTSISTTIGFNEEKKIAIEKATAKMNRIAKCLCNPTDMGAYIPQYCSGYALENYGLESDEYGTFHLFNVDFEVRYTDSRQLVSQAETISKFKIGSNNDVYFAGDDTGWEFKKYTGGCAYE